jgi:GNAT superfamily N-acetyltransferase
MADFVMWERPDYRLSTDPADVSLDVVHAFLSQESYWAKNIPRDTVARSLRSSIPFSLLHGSVQVGFARVTSDLATVAYLGDVFILPAHRGRGLSKWMMACIMSHPDLQGLRRWTLATADAHGLYAQFGFTPLKAPTRWMEKHNPDVYLTHRG